MSATIQELAVLACGGDAAAYGELVERTWERLVRAARSVVGDGDAEDAVQDALIGGWRRLSSLRDPGAVEAWLLRITLRRCLARARRRRLQPLDEAPEPAVWTDPAAGVDVERLLASLAPRQRAVMYLTVIEGLSDGEIGALLGLRAGSVRAHRRRARARLRRLLGEADDG